MTEIDQFLKHTVSINTVTFSEGSRSITTVDDIPAFITQRRRLGRSVAGDSEESHTVVYLKATQTITREDEIIFDGETRPVKDIHTPRNLAGVMYKRVFLS